MVYPGQGLLLKGFFANGTECSYERPFLVIENNGSILKALNVSSVKGKSHKLLYPSNKNLNPFKPPFLEPSFVKLDELYEMELFPNLQKAIVDKGNILDSTLFSKIISDFKSYSSSNSVPVVTYSKTAIEQRNPILIEAKTSFL